MSSSAPHISALSLSLLTLLFSLSLYRLPNVHTALHLCQLKLPIWRLDPRCTGYLYTTHQQTHVTLHIHQLNNVLPLPTLSDCDCMYTHRGLVVYCVMYPVHVIVLWFYIQFCVFQLMFMFTFMCMTLCVCDCLLLPQLGVYINAVRLSNVCLCMCYVKSDWCLLHKTRLYIIYFLWFKSSCWMSLYGHDMCTITIFMIMFKSDFNIRTTQYTVRTANRAITQWITHNELTRNIECWYNIIGRIPLII
jgi:hypothetical protein